MKPRATSSTTSTTKIILKATGPHKHQAVSRVTMSGISMPADVAKHFGDAIQQAITNQNELRDLLIEKSKIEGLNQKVKTFINDEIQSLTQHPIAKNANYVHILSLLGSSAYAQVEDFLMEEMVEIRKVEQKLDVNAEQINVTACKK